MISIIVPAHNECSVIDRTLQALVSSAEPGELDVIVVCNGCTDETAEIARRYGPPIRVIETPIAHKGYALNLGDKAAHSFPRVFVDADVIFPLAAIRQLTQHLAQGNVLAVAPVPNFDLSGCSRLVRLYFKVRSNLPQSREGIGGSGVYALSEAGRNRFREFPDIVADDGYVRIQFKPQERQTIDSVNSTVFAPRTIKNLIATRTRVQYGNLQLAGRYPELWKNNSEPNNRAIIRLLRFPSLWSGILTYCFANWLARRRAKAHYLNGSAFIWQRDNTSRNYPIASDHSSSSLR